MEIGQLFQLHHAILVKRYGLDLDADTHFPQDYGELVKKLWVLPFDPKVNGTFKEAANL